VYAYDEDCGRILDAVKELGYPGRILKQDTGVRIDSGEMEERDGVHI
jgi:galactokinase